MQFRPQGNRIQVLAYRSYDKAKKRAQVKLLGSFSKLDFSLSDGLIEALTDDEKTELQSRIASIRQSHEKTIRQASVRYISHSIKSVSDSLTDPECASLVTEKVASELFESIDGLAKALRKLGFRRVAKSGAKVTAE